jgi:serine/threonine protein kinase
MVEKQEELHLEAKAPALASQDGDAPTATEISNNTVLMENEIPQVKLVESAEPADCHSSALEESAAISACVALAPGDIRGALGQIGDYDLLEELSTTPVARFYRAYSKTVQKDVAIKVIRPELCQDAAVLKRFRQEAKAASEVDHPNLGSIYDFGVTEAGCAYVVTDFLKGRSLKDLIAREGFLEPDRALEIFKQVCQGLNHLHQNNLVHRNLNPSNIFLVDTESSHDFVKVVDFGFGRIVNATRSDGENVEPEPYADPRYMSPEQLMGYKLDGRSDIYSVGLLMYEALCGKTPYGNQNRMHTIMKQLNAKPRSFRSVSGDLEISDRLEQIVFKCLQKNRSERYSSISDLCMDLDLCPGYSLTNEKSGVRPSKRRSEREPASASKWNRPLVFIAIAAVTFGSMAGTYSFWKELRRNSVPPIWGRGAFGFAGPVYGAPWRHVSHDAIKRQADEAFNHGRFLEAVELYSRAINTFKRHKRIEDPVLGQKANQPELVALYTQLGRSHYEKAADPETELERTSRNLGAASVVQTNYHDAQIAFENAMKFHDYPYGKADSDLLLGMANAYSTMRNYKAANQALQISLDVLKNSPDPAEEIAANNAMGTNYMDMGDFTMAEKHYRQAVELSKKYKKVSYVAENAATMAADLPKALLAQEKYGKAEWWAKENIKAIMDSQPAKGIVTVDQAALKTNYETLVESYQKRGKTSEAEKAALMVHSLE